MPELPEVELVARSLDRLVSGLRIEAAKLIRPGLAPENTPREFARTLRGAKFERVGRRGKHILFELDAGQVLITHLRMTGRFLLLPERCELPKHTHAVFRLDDGRALVPEPFSEEFSHDYLRAVFARTRRMLKETLLDQTKVTGLGNIYAAEA